MTNFLIIKCFAFFSYISFLRFWSHKYAFPLQCVIKIHNEDTVGDPCFLKSLKMSFCLMAFYAPG